MSLDLLAAFEDAPQETRDLPKQTSDALIDGSHDNVDWQNAADISVDEDFGDFEDAGPIQNVSQPTSEPHGHTNRQFDMTGVTAATEKDASSFRVKDTITSPLSSQQHSTEPQKDSRIGRHPFADHMDMLFAADDNEYDAGQDELQDLSTNPEAAMAYSKRIIQSQLEAEARTPAWSSTSMPFTQSQHMNASPAKHIEPRAVKPRNLDILFDASDLSDEVSESNDDDTGEWGDFEGNNSVTQAVNLSGANGQKHSQRSQVKESNDRAQSGQSAMQHATATFDLLGLDELQDRIVSHASATNPKPVATEHHLEAKKPLARSAASPNAMIEDGLAAAPWEDFDDMVPPIAVSSDSEATRIPNAGSQAVTLPKIPPANVPPPSMLLSAFPEILRQPISQDMIVDRLATAKVLAHILAGRKQRWRRSSTLAASMRIGPAALGGKGGMKLTGIDRTETSKEDREVGEVLSVWRAQLGRLRSAYATFAGSMSAENHLQNAKMPDISDLAPIRTLKPHEGGLNAPHECALCGLKRQERVMGVDDTVDDSFGEWWVEGADMHTACATWWVKHELFLRSR